MSIIKSLSVGNGDMFYINHNSDNLTIIDCNYVDENQRDHLFQSLKTVSKGKQITRFISTHPDEDHIHGLDILDNTIGILNFYVVENEAIKLGDETDGFKRYCELRDDKAKAFYVYKGCSRKWMNLSSDTDDQLQLGGSGINYIWPITTNVHFKEALEVVKKGSGFNNISPIFTYSLEDGIKAMWMGDMETDFLDKIKDVIDWPRIDVLFAPHHGRKSGHVSVDVLEKLNPQIIVIGEAPSKDLDYYRDYNTIKQNSAKGITFDAQCGVVHVYVQNAAYDYPVDCLKDKGMPNKPGEKYLGSFIPYAAEL